ERDRHRRRAAAAAGAARGAGAVEALADCHLERSGGRRADPAGPAAPHRCAIDGRGRMNLDDALQVFIAEGRELLQAMESALLALDASPGAALDNEAVNAIFRAAHTIKGSAGLFGLDHVVAFTHVAESVLDEVRAGR